MLFDASVTIITTSDFIKNDVKNTLMHCLSFVKMSVRVIKHKLIAILLIDSVISQRDSVISQHGFAISQRGFATSQHGFVRLHFRKRIVIIHEKIYQLKLI